MSVVTLRPSQRAAALGGVALLAAATSLAVTSRSGGHPATLPVSDGSYTALAGATSPATLGKRTACGVRVGPNTIGVSNPVLPCGVRLYISYRGNHVLTQVIGHGPQAPGRQFNLTGALARELGLAGTKRIQWSYAAAS